MSSKRLKDIVKHQHKWYGKWHTIAGLSAGFVLIIVSLTGALLVFEQELDVWLNPDLFTFEEKGKLLSLQEVREKVEYDHPTWEVERLFIQDQKNNAILLFAEETGKPHRHPHPQIIVNPYTGEVMGSRIYKYSLMGVIRNLHRTLLIPFIGRYLVGLSSLFCVILMITGLRQWIPKKRKQLKDRLTVRWSGSKKRINYDVHNSLGFYFSPFITLIAITGVMITFSTIVLLFLFLLNFQAPESLASIFNQKSTYVEGKTQLSIDEASKAIFLTMPEAEITGVSMPFDSAGTYQFNVREPSSSQVGDNSFVSIDQYSGKIVFTSDQKELQLGKVYTNWITPIHYGTFGGLPTRILALISALVTCTLFFTGFYIWYGRWKKRKKSKIKRKKLNPTRTKNSTRQKAS